MLLQIWSEEWQCWATINGPHDPATLERMSDGWQQTAMPTAVWRIVSEEHRAEELREMVEAEQRLAA